MTEQQIMDHMSQLIRVGFVTSRQAETHRVQVELRDTVTARLITKWLPVLCPRASGDLHYDLPDIGDQVLCLFLPYGLEQGFVVGAMYGRQTPPVSDPEKFHRRFKDGATIEYDRANHALSATIPGTATIKCAGPMTLEAPTVYVRGTLVNTAKDGSPGKAVFSGGMEILDGGVSVPDADVKAGNVSLVSHTTTGVQPGDGISDIPVGGVAGGVAAAVMAGMAGGSDGSGSGSSNAARHVASLRSVVDAGGSDTEKLLLCLPDIAAAMAEEQSNANDRQGWLYLHVMFEQWLGGPGNEDALPRPGFFRLLGGTVPNFAATYPEAAAYFRTTYGAARLVASQAEYDALHTAVYYTNADGETEGWNGIGGVNKFFWDTLNDTLTLPDLAGMSPEQIGCDGLGVGGVREDRVRNATGSFGSVWPRAAVGGGTTPTSGCIIPQTIGSGGMNVSGGSYNAANGIDSSRVVPSGPHVSPRAYGSLLHVYLGQPAS